MPKYYNCLTVSHFEPMQYCIQEGFELTIAGIDSEQHFTRPPGHFTEASTIKALEQHGIGRPSTYAPIIRLLQVRYLFQCNAAISVGLPLALPPLG